VVTAVNPGRVVDDNANRPVESNAIVIKLNGFTVVVDVPLKTVAVFCGSDCFVHRY
jgi:hypothetical protein